MKPTVRALALLAVALALLGATGCNQLRARDQLNKGVQAYKNSRYEESIEHFKNAVSLDPNLGTARLYLATAYRQLYVPNADSPDNVRYAQQALLEFQNALKGKLKGDQKVTALKHIATLSFDMKNMDQAREYFKKVIEINPNDPEPYYWVAVIDWTQSYQPRMTERAKLGLGPNDVLKDRKVCEQLRSANLDKVNDGMQMLQKALQLRPEFEDAMAYVNLMYREKADLECGDPAARAADLTTADSWVDKTLAARKAKEQKQQASGITLEPAKQ